MTPRSSIVDIEASRRTLITHLFPRQDMEQRISEIAPRAALW